MIYTEMLSIFLWLFWLTEIVCSMLSIWYIFEEYFLRITKYTSLLIMKCSRTSVAPTWRNYQNLCEFFGNSTHRNSGIQREKIRFWPGTRSLRCNKLMHSKVGLSHKKYLEPFTFHCFPVIFCIQETQCRVVTVASISV